MTGNDKIIERILEESRQAAAAVEAEAETKATARLDEEKAALDKQASTAADARAAAGDRQIRAAQSAAALLVRNAQLERRREEIDRTLDETLAFLRAMPAEAYFQWVARQVAAHRDGKGGELLLSAEDLARVPSDFAATLGVTLCDTPAKIDGGCILRYGDIEENLTFEALLDEQRDRLEDIICRELWGE